MTDTAKDRIGLQHTFAADAEIEVYQRLLGLFDQNPVARNEVLGNVGLFLTRPTLQRVLFAAELYQQVLDVHGVVMEFGCRWGQNLSLFLNMRTLFEPYNPTRKIIGFDTFEGFVVTSEEDGANELTQLGNYAVTQGYQSYLQQILDCHRALAPRPHLETFELRAGDATVTVPEYISDHPETIIALAYFDMDLYQPTREVLRAIGPRLTRGSVVAFDELCHPSWPGETLAVLDELGLGSVRMQRSPYSAAVSYFVVE